MNKFIVYILCLTFNPVVLFTNSLNTTDIIYNKNNNVNYYSDSILNFYISEIAPNFKTYYDIQSNGSSHLIQQDPGNPSNIHAAFMFSPNRDSLVSSRRTVYCFSSDYGTSWIEMGPTFPSISSGFPVMLILSDGTALIGNHTRLGGTIERAQWFADVAPGAGTFIQLDPGIFGPTPALWPVGIQTKSLSHQTKFVFVAGNLINRSLSVTSSNYSGYIPEPQISNSFKCAMAKSLNGKIGLAYIMEGSVTPGKVSFKESSDDGVTWSTPVLIWDPLANNSYGAFNGIDIGYDIETPNVVFETVKYVSNIPDIHSTAKIQFWSPAVNSGIPIAIDSSNNMIGTNPQSDGYAAVCRPVIGYLTPNDRICIIAYEKAHLDTSANGNNFFEIWFRALYSTGNIWSSAKKIPNLYNRLGDYRYVSISDFNGRNNGSSYVNFLFQRDTIAGSNVNGADRSLANIYFCKYLFNYFLPGVINYHSGIPKSFSLKQNYPNPFNPKTYIEFDIPDESDVKIEIYNSLGKLVDVLTDQRLAAGFYRADWSAENYSSGIYFYSIRAGNFYDSKKMVLVK